MNLMAAFRSLNFIQRRTVSNNSSADSSNASTRNNSLRESKKKSGAFTLPGAKIIAFGTAIFQRLRIMDDINFF